MHADGTQAVGRKFGVYDDDLPVFAWLRDGIPGRRRCVEAQVMDLADDVAYSVHDLEDGVVAGRISLPLLEDAGQRREVWQTVRDWYLPASDDAELEAAFARVRAIGSWVSGDYTGTRASLAGLKNMTSDLIGIFCGSVQHASRREHAGPLIRHQADLVVPRETEVEIAVLKGIAAHYVMRAEDRVVVMEQQRELVSDLFAVLADRGPDALDRQFAEDHRAAPDDAARTRVVVDQIASLTDASAQHWHARLCGGRASGA